MLTLNVESLFEQLVYYRDQTADFSMLGPWLKRHVTACSFPDLNDIPFKTATYTRNYITKKKPNQHQSFEALIMRWDKQAKTPIHGHPAFSFYYVISGLFKMELFDYTATSGLELKKTQLFYPSEMTWFMGLVGKYDNFIHQVSCQEPGHTLHIYSEDPRRGVSYEKRNWHSREKST